MKRLTFIFFSLVFIFFFAHFSWRISLWFFSFFKPNFFEKEIKALKQENASLSSLLSQNQEILKENENFRKLLEIKESVPERKYILAKTIGLSPFNYQPYILVFVEPGLVGEGKTAILPGNILFGFVEKISGKKAKIATVFCPSFSASVKILSPDQKNPVIGLAKGKGNKVIIDLISKDEEIEKGAKIFTSGFDQKFPANLYLGEVKTIEKGDNLFQKIEIEPPFRWQEIFEVFILAD